MYNLFLCLYAVRQHVIRQYMLVHINDIVEMLRSTISNITMQSMPYLHNMKDITQKLYF